MSDTTVPTASKNPQARARQILYDLHEGDTAPLWLLETRLTWRVREATQRAELLYEAGAPFQEEARAATAELEFLQGLVTLVAEMNSGIIKASSILYAIQHPDDFYSPKVLADLEMEGAR